MAKNNSTVSEAPLIYSGEVILWLTLAIERDYIARGVFPEYRTETAVEVRTNARSLHYLTFEKARALFEDAQSRCTGVAAGVKFGYISHAKRLKEEIENAQKWRVAFRENKPVRICERWSGEHWIGTKAQLASMGISLDGSYPRESGGKARWALTHDLLGRKVHIKKAPSEYPGMFTAWIDIPWEPSYNAETENANLSDGLATPISQRVARHLHLVWSAGVAAT